jgi:glutamate-1-semialdehyde 2,1-aminomutase
MAASEAVLDEVLEHRDTMYTELHGLADMLSDGLHNIMAQFDVPHAVQHVGPMISLFLTDEQGLALTSYRDVRRHGDFARFIEFQHEMQRTGVFFHPNMFEPMFLSTAHTRDDIKVVLDRAEAAARRCLFR